jgi:hypothetical protein
VPAAALQEALGLEALPEIGGTEPVDEAPLTELLYGVELSPRRAHDAAALYWTLPARRSR